MNEALIKMYRSVGYIGPLPDTDPRTMPFTGTASDPIEELPPLDLKGLNELEQWYEKEPDKLLKTMGHLNDHPMTSEYFGEIIELTRNALTHPDDFLKLRTAHSTTRMMVESNRFVMPDKYPNYPDIRINPQSKKYEPGGDAIGWVLNTGSYFLLELLGIDKKKGFRFHDKNTDSNFLYSMKDSQGVPFGSGRPVRVGLFADFGTGEYHSLYIARHLERQFELDYAIHLGDVYYAGRTSEFRKYMWEPTENLMQKTRTFWMAGNHEKFANYKPYYNFMDKKKGMGPSGLQEQEGSYFCIRSDQFQIIGIDTAFFKNGRYKRKELLDWLKERLHEGKDHSPSLVTILLSPNEPYNLGSKKQHSLLKDLGEFVNDNMIDLWFWGNTHYSALFQKTSKTPFIGSCIGHAGHPIKQKNILNAFDKDKHGKGLAPASWVDTSLKFPQEDFPNLRPDLNNHGFCIMELHPDKIILEYYDWLMRKLNSVNFPIDHFT
jgi:Calcineurin-like phosphoesterase